MLSILLSILLASVALAGVGPPRGADGSETAANHNIHVSYGRVAVEGNQVLCRIRYFTHDLEASLRQYHQDPHLVLAATPRADSLYAAYAGEKLKLEANEQPLDSGRILSSGEEGELWWYVVSYEAPEDVRTLTIENTLLFDAFTDQKNLFKVVHFPDEESHSLYFVRGSDTYTLTF